MVPKTKWRRRRINATCAESWQTHLSSQTPQWRRGRILAAMMRYFWEFYKKLILV
jgi:hypothetical protein